MSAGRWQLVAIVGTGVGFLLGLSWSNFMTLSPIDGSSALLQQGGRVSALYWASTDSLVNGSSSDNSIQHASPTKPAKLKGPHKVSSFLKHYGLGIGNMEVPPVWKSGIKYRTVVDVGANDGGDYSIPAVRDAHHVVYAFEPVPSTRARFIANVKNCGISNITTLIEVEPGKPVDMDKIREVNINKEEGHLFIIGAAASDTTGKGIIVEHDEMSYVASPDVSLEFTQRSHKTEIALVRVDDIVHEDVFLFKSDAQGYDHNVFLGASKLFSDYHVELATAEYIPKVMDAYRPGAAVQMLRFFEENGFICFDWTKNEHIPLERPSDFESFARTFLELCPPEYNCKCQDDRCFRQDCGKWDELLCVNLM